KLVEEGVLSLDDTVEDYLPGKIPQGDEMTLKMLLNHSAGIADATTNISFWEEVYSNPTRDWTHQEILSISTPNTPVFTPGTAYDYSNTGYYLLGMIIEANTGSTVDSLFQEKITQPANLNLTSLSRQGELEEPCTNGYAWLFTTEEVVETKNWNFSWDWTAGAGVSTARDMLDFADELFNGNILESATVELMISPESFAPNASYGLGLGILPAEAPGNIFGTKLIGWSGANPGTATQWYYFPAYETTFFIAINRNDIAEGPGSSPPLNGTAISTDILIQAWEVVKDELDICEGRRIL
ncbi:MAG: beta-lactamase family protein, partial [Candidatus Cloacimonetes bacterium]|nr:beta-lactamase family protein [Candidatus Cloacimonadota bacterium]